MKIQVLVFFLLFSNVTCFSQSSDDLKIDSLLAELKSLPNDTLRVIKLNEIGNLYLFTDFKESSNFGNQSRTLAEKLNYRKGLGYACKLLGLINAYQSNYYEADNYFKEALKNFESINFKDGISNILNNLGSLNFSIGNDAKSIEYHLKSLRVSEGTNNKFRIGTNLNNLGTVYSGKADSVDIGLGYFLKALSIFEEIKYNEGIGTAAVNIGEIYFKKEKYDSALPFFIKSVEMFEGTADAAYALSYVGEIYAKRNDYVNAFNYHNQAIEVSEKLDAQQSLAQSLLSLGKTQRKVGEVLKSIQTYKRAQQISEEIKARYELKNSFEELSKSYNDVADFKNAYKYQVLLTGINDTLYNIDEDRKSQQLKFNFDINEKERTARELVLKQLQEKRVQTLALQRQKVISFTVFFVLLSVIIVGVLTMRFFQVRKVKRIIEKEKNRSDNLLLNILPKDVAEELKAKGESLARNFDDVTILFSDFKDFTAIAEKLKPQELVAEINTCFKAFDQIITKYGIEKIKTIGDSYMAAGGLGTNSTVSAMDVVKAGIEMQVFINARALELQKAGKAFFEMRVGIHTGPVVAGIVGVKKFQYDIWGDSVNTASRMESSGQVGKVNISHYTYELIKECNDFIFEHRGKVEAKNMGLVEMYFVTLSPLNVVST